MGVAERWRANLEGIAQREECGMTVLYPARGRPHRRVLYVNSYGMSWAWSLVVKGECPGNHLWGCQELVRLGYEVALPAPDPGNPGSPTYSGDRKLVAVARDWLGSAGVLYCAFNVLRWTALARRLNYLKCPVVGLLYGHGDDLPFASAYAGLIGLTPAGFEQARLLAPRAKAVHLGWGLDLDYYPQLPVVRGYFLSCGQTRRDHATLCGAASLVGAELRVISKDVPQHITWPANAHVLSHGDGPIGVGLSYRALIHEHYAGASAALVILRPDADERFACGFTNILEALALGRPVITTRTGATVRELDVEREGCGLFVPPGDARALAAAINRLAADPAMTASMGYSGRRLCEDKYEISGYAARLHAFFQSL